MPAICFVCLGNICRSPMAHAIMEHLIAERNLSDWSVDSCGTGAWHIGNRCDPRTATELKRHGITSTHRARQLTESDYHHFDYLLVMDHANRADVEARQPDSATATIALLGDYDSERPGDEVDDPYYGGDDGFASIYRQCLRACEGLIAELSD